MNPDRATIASARHETAAVNGTQLHYVTAGDQGVPVLLVHGFPETWWAFRKLIPLLAARHRVVDEALGRMFPELTQHHAA